MKRIIFMVMTILGFSAQAMACTNFIIGKGASADGSVMVTYNDDSYGKFGFLDFYPAATHAPGDVRRIISWEDGQYRGTIPEVAQTYNVVGNINEYQVCICETTFGGREELANKEGLLDYGSLIYIALQRSRTAREAISVMTSLVAEYGYCSAGETFSICDKEEAWIMEMVGRGEGEKGALWVAIRIPDECVAVHANSSRITRFNMKDRKNVLCSKDIVAYARRKGWYIGKDADFSFRDTYSPEISYRSCESRCWSFMDKMDHELMKKYLPYILREEGAPTEMPLYIKPGHKVGLQEVKDLMRDHYEGTPLAFTDDLGAGAWGMPYRPRPLKYEDSEGNRYFNERAISTQQTAFTLVSQLRSWLPDAIGGVMWFGVDDANMVAYTPVYCCTDRVPECYAKATASAVYFNMKSAFWLCNIVSNIIYQRYSLIMPDFQKVRNRMEKTFEDEQDAVVAKACALSDADRVAFLTAKTAYYADTMMDEWQRLLGYITVKYNDMVVKKEKDGRFDTICHEKCRVSNPGYPVAYRDKIARETGSRYKVVEGSVSSQPVAIGRKPQNARPAAVLPSHLVYRMSGDYANFVPVMVNDAGEIVSYPDPVDITESQKPVALGDGWYLDRRGISQKTAFLDYTYEEYHALRKVPSVDVLKAHIVAQRGVSAIWSCGTQQRTIDEYRQLVRDGFPGCRCIVPGF